MDELERALLEYLQGRFSRGDIVFVKEIRNELAPRFIDTALLSEILRAIRRIVARLVRAAILQRIKPGVYVYWPDGRPDGLPSDFVADLAPVALVAPETYLPRVFDGSANPFESVASLARSRQFLVQRDLADVNLELLQGLSF